MASTKTMIDSIQEMLEASEGWTVFEAKNKQVLIVFPSQEQAQIFENALCDLLSKHHDTRNGFAKTHYAQYPLKKEIEKPKHHIEHPSKKDVQNGEVYFVEEGWTIKGHEWASGMPRLYNKREQAEQAANAIRLRESAKI